MNQKQQESVEAIDILCQDFLDNMPSMEKEALEVAALTLVKRIQEANRIMASQRKQIDWLVKACLVSIDVNIRGVSPWNKKARQKLNKLKQDVLRFKR